jgi:hypothetical protein
MPYILFTVLLGSPGTAFIVGYLKTWNVYYLSAGLLCAVLIVCVFLWLSHYRIEFSDDRITVGRLAAMKRSLRRDEIEEWYTVVGLLDREGRVGSLLRMVIEPTPSSGQKPFVIPLRFFTPGDIQVLEMLLPEGRRARSEE